MRTASGLFIVVVMFLAGLVPASVCGAGDGDSYTVQAATFKTSKGAIEFFEQFSSRLPPSVASRARVDEIGGLYAVRLGKFDSRNEAEAFRTQLGGAGRDTVVVRSRKHAKTLLGPSLRELGDSVHVPKSDAVPKSGRENSIYVIQTGSYRSFDKARGTGVDLARRLGLTRADELRVERIGRFFAVRIGAYGRRSEAVEDQRRFGKNIAGASVLRTRFLRDRIVWTPEGTPASAEAPSMENKTSTTVFVEDIARTYRSGRVKEALSMVDQALTANPRRWELHAWRGSILIALDEYAGARESLRRAVRGAPEEPTFHRSLAYCLLFQGDAREAVREFEKALALDPADVDSLAGLGAAYGRLDERESAAEIKDRLQQLDTEAAIKLETLLRKLNPG